MLKKRIIPCLDVTNGQVVKGIHFKNLQHAGDAIELAQRYEAQGADELVFLDITATIEKKKTVLTLAREVAKCISIPFTIGGGINSLEIAKAAIECGADKVCINSAALKNPFLITEIKEELGAQCVVIAIDTKRVNNEHRVFINAGKDITEWNTFNWIKEVEKRGAGELLITSIDADGTKQGFEVSLMKEISNITTLPLISSGGAGTQQHFAELFTNTSVTGALAASIFHFNELSIPNLKNYLVEQKIPIRLQ